MIERTETRAPKVPVEASFSCAFVSHSDALDAPALPCIGPKSLFANNPAIPPVSQFLLSQRTRFAPICATFVRPEG